MFAFIGDPGDAMTQVSLSYHTLDTLDHIPPGASARALSTER